MTLNDGIIIGLGIFIAFIILSISFAIGEYLIESYETWRARHAYKRRLKRRTFK